MKTFHSPVSIIIADDHEILREGICSTIQKYPDIIIVAEAANGKELVALTDKHQPDVIITDIEMPLMDGIEATAIISEKYPKIGIIALSMYDDDKLILDMLNAGARGYLLKNAPKEEIIEAIHTMEKEDAYFCRDIVNKMARLLKENRISKKQQKVTFSDKELRVINLICRQFQTKEISAMLNLSPRTIEGYRESILQKIGAPGSIGIVIYAIANQIFDVNDPENMHIGS